MTARIRPARPREAAALGALALRSKAWWGYDEAFMAACRDELSPDPDRVTADRAAVAYDPGSGEVLGFVTLEGAPPRGSVGMLFVAPEAIGRGAGRLLYDHALAAAGRLGFTELTIEADPNAEGFYEAMGAVTVGRAPSGSIPGRTLPLMTTAVPEGRRTGFLTASDGTRLAYHEVGTAGGPPLVVVPGGPMRASEYLGDLGGLAARRRLVLLDLRGTGSSREPADPSSYRCDRQTADLEALRAHLGLERLDLVAHSAGCALAVLYAAARPERVRTLTLLTPNLTPLGRPSTLEHGLRAALARADEPWYPAAAEALPRIYDGSADDADFDAAAPLGHGRWDAAAREHEAAAARQFNEAAAGPYYAPGAFDPPRTERELDALDAPVLLLAGERDARPLPEVALEAAGCFPRGRAVVQPGAGHYPWLDDAESFVGTVADFTG